LEQVPQLEVVVRADDRAAGHARERFDVPQHVTLGEAGEHADMEQ